MMLELLHKPAGAKAASHPPLLFLHGTYMSARVWDVHFFDYFAAKGYGCHAISLRGHGSSEGVLSWSGLSDYVEDLASAMAPLPEPPVLIGHSLGGLVVQHALAHHPCRAAVLLATMPPSGATSLAMHLSMTSPDILW